MPENEPGKTDHTPDPSHFNEAQQAANVAALDLAIENEATKPGEEQPRISGGSGATNPGA